MLYRIGVGFFLGGDIEEDHMAQVFKNTMLKKIFLHKLTKGKNGRVTHSVIYILLILLERRSWFTECVRSDGETIN